MRFGLLAMVTWLLAASSVQAKDIDFELVNKSGYTMTKVWVAKHDTGAWGRNLLKLALANEASARISVVNASNWNLWDLRIEYSRPKKSWEVFSDGFELPKVARIIISVESGNRWRAHYENGSSLHSNSWVRSLTST